MYSAPGHAGVNHEDYLLGKAIDKAVDPLAINDEKVYCILFLWSEKQNLIVHFIVQSRLT